jgi:glycosyltransferase involved in cell wall biosynthesis
VSDPTWVRTRHLWGHSAASDFRFILSPMLSVVLITFNEEANLGRTLESVKPLVSERRGEIIVVDSGSTDRTGEIAKSFGAKVFVEAWKGYAGQKNSAIEKATGDWILSLDADEEISTEFCKLILPFTEPEGLAEAGLAAATGSAVKAEKEPGGATIEGYWIARKNHFLGRWIKHGGFWPDPKLRLFRRGCGRFEDRSVHETVKVSGQTVTLKHGAIFHHSYPTLSDYIDHMNRYSSLGAGTVVAVGQARFSVINIVIRPWLTFFYNYFLRLGFLDGREGLLLHLYHAVYVSWKYAKAWEIARSRKP